MFKIIFRNFLCCFQNSCFENVTHSGMLTAMCLIITGVKSIFNEVFETVKWALAQTCFQQLSLSHKSRQVIRYFNIMRHQLVQGLLMEHQKRNYQELSLDSLKDKGWLRYLCYFRKLLQLKCLPIFMKYSLPSKGRKVTQIA